MTTNSLLYNEAELYVSLCTNQILFILRSITLNILRLIMFSEISFADFTKVHICAGTITDAKLNPKANKPAYIVTIDFGGLGLKTSSAQITEHYSADSLLGKQILAVMNFPSKIIAGVKSEVLILACVSDDEGTVLIEPNKSVSNGTRVL